MSPFDTEQVHRYYDRNTSSFVALGRAAASAPSIVQCGVPAPRRASRRFTSSRIASPRSCAVWARRMSSTSVAVWGRASATSTRLLPITGTGVTLSPIQVRAARERIEAEGLSDRVDCIEGDFGDLPDGMQAAEVAYAIESFVHAPEPARFFAEAGRLVRPGGALVICDDVRRPGSSRQAERSIHRFKRGWHVNSLLEVDELRSLASEGGFEHESTEDLSSYLELRRARDRMGWRSSPATAGRHSLRPPGRRQRIAEEPGQRMDRLRPHGLHPQGIARRAGRRPGRS